MSNPRYAYGGSRSDVNSKSKLGMSNGSIDSRISLTKEHGMRQKGSRVRRSVYLWTPHDVRLWLQKKHRKYYDLYSPLFDEHDISGRALVRLDEMKLQTMGVDNREHRMDLREQILKLRIKHEQNELKLLRKVDKD